MILPDAALTSDASYVLLDHEPRSDLMLGARDHSDSASKAVGSVRGMFEPVEGRVKP
jgi:hypothetical protein